MVNELHRALPDVAMFAIVNLPANEEQRETFLELKPMYEKAGISSFIIGDRMESGSVTQDSTIGELFAGYTSASLFSDLNARFNNVASNVGNIIQFSYVYGEVPARPVPTTRKGKPVYVVYRDEVKSEARRLVERIELSDCAISVRGPINPKRHQTYDLILLALSPDDVRRISAKVEDARETDYQQHQDENRPHLSNKGNYHAVYTPWVQKVAPDHPRCEIAVIRLRALRDEPGDLEEMVKFPERRRKVEPQAKTAQVQQRNGQQSQGAGETPAANGEVPEDVFGSFK